MPFSPISVMSPPGNICRSASNAHADTYNVWIVWNCNYFFLTISSYCCKFNPLPNSMLFLTVAFCIQACCGTYATESTSFTCPLTLFICPSIADINDDLPDPTWPTTATSLPRLTRRLMSLSVGVVCFSDHENEPPSISTAGRLVLA